MYIFTYIVLIRARETFTTRKRGLDFYIKHQLDLIPQLDSHKFQHIPRIIVAILERVGCIIHQKGIDKANVYQCLNGNHEWKDEYENSLNHLKSAINHGVWSCINETDDIIILIEMLFDWIDDSVTCVFNSSTLDSIFKNNFDLELNKMIVNRKEYNIETRKLIIDKFKNELKMSEFECLSCIANFLSFIYPDDIQDPVILNEFNLMFDKLSIYLLGFNIEMVYENSNLEEAQTCKRYIEQFKDMLNFFSIVCKYDWFEHTGRKGSFNIMSNYLKKLYISDENERIISTKADGKFFNKMKTCTNIEDIINSNTNRDDFLLNMYKALEQYFNKEKIKPNGGGKINNDLENFNDFFISFIDFIDNIKNKGNSVSNSPEGVCAVNLKTRQSQKLLNGSPKSILKAQSSGVNSQLMDISPKKDTSSFALILKNDKEVIVDEMPEKLIRFQPDSSKYKTQVIKRIRFDSKVESNQNVVSFLNNEGTVNSKGSMNDKPKSRKTERLKASHKALPEVFGGTYSHPIENERQDVL
jgi:hypothetical protein